MRTRMGSGAWAVSAGALLAVTGSAWGQCERQGLPRNDAAARDEFGSAVAIGADALAVGSRRDDTGARDAGSVYLYARQGQQWVLDVELTRANGQFLDEFGASLSLDGTRLAVGAPGVDTMPGADQGAVYIYERQGGAWTLTATILAGDRQSGDDFGRSVALEGEWLVVGASRDDEGNDIDAGSVYLFRLVQGQWVQQDRRTLPAGPNRGGSLLGSSVALGGGVVIAGAPKASDGGTFRGTALSWRVENGSLVGEGELPAQGLEPGDEFGTSVSIDGGWALVGAPLDDERARDAGAVYVFERGNNSWSQAQKVLDPIGRATDWWGQSVSLSAGRAIVGKPLADVLGDDSGGAAIIANDGGVWEVGPQFTAAGSGSGDRVGLVVAAFESAGVVGVPLADVQGLGDAGRAIAVNILSCLCFPDLVGDGQVDGGDFLRFLSLFFDGDPRVDLNFDGSIDGADFLEFLSLFFEGC